MSQIAAAQWTAVATIVLAAFAVVTAVFAFLAFRAQAEQVGTLKEQSTDEKALIGQQAELLQVQSGQLEVQHQQLDDQRTINARQAEVMELQAQELRESLDERKREAEARRAAQASQVFIWVELADTEPPVLEAHVVNSSHQAVYDPEVRWYRGTASDGRPNLLHTIMPGAEATARHKFPLDSNMAVIGGVVRFRDAAGVTWRRRTDGALTDLEG